MWTKIFKWTWPYILLVVMGVALWDSYQKAGKYRERSQTLETTITDMEQKVKQTEVRLNDSVTLYQAEVKSLKYTNDNVQAKYNNLLYAMSLKSKDVSSVIEVASQVVRVDTVYAVTDTFGTVKANMDDGFVRIDVNVMSDRKTIIDYSIRDSLSVFCTQKKHSLLFGLIKWRDTESVRVVNHNPKARIVSLKSIDVIE